MLVPIIYSNMYQRHHCMMTLTRKPYSSSYVRHQPLRTNQATSRTCYVMNLTVPCTGTTARPTGARGTYRVGKYRYEYQYSTALVRNRQEYCPQGHTPAWGQRARAALFSLARYSRTWQGTVHTRYTVHVLYIYLVSVCDQVGAHLPTVGIVVPLRATYSTCTVSADLSADRSVQGERRPVRSPSSPLEPVPPSLLPSLPPSLPPPPLMDGMGKWGDQVGRWGKWGDQVGQVGQVGGDQAGQVGTPTVPTAPTWRQHSHVSALAPHRPHSRSALRPAAAPPLSALKY